MDQGRYFGNMVWVSFGTGRVMRKRVTTGQVRTCKHLLTTPLLTELLKLHDNGASFIVMNCTTSSVIGHFVLVAHRIVYVCFICYLCIVYKIETTASSSKSEVWKYFVIEGTENKVKCRICEIEVDHKGGSTSAAKKGISKERTMWKLLL